MRSTLSKSIELLAFTDTLLDELALSLFFPSTLSSLLAGCCWFGCWLAGAPPLYPIHSFLSLSLFLPSRLFPTLCVSCLLFFSDVLSFSLSR